MSKLSQKDAVHNAVTSVLSSNDIEFNATTNVGTLMNRQLRAQVNEALFNGFRAGTIDLDREFTDTELRAYVSGLQSNWIRKDKRLNGGVQPVSKQSTAQVSQVAGN
jgi:hypothetical protein